MADFNTLMNIAGASLASSTNNLGSRSRNTSQGGSYTRTDNSRAAAYNAMMAREAMDFSAKEAKKNRDWQEMMSNTRYQRAVKDMKAAGINPVLRAQLGGASTPGGAAGAGAAAAIGADAEGGSSQISNMMSSSGWAMVADDLMSAGQAAWNLGGKELFGKIVNSASYAFGKAKDWLTKPAAEYENNYRK